MLRTIWSRLAMLTLLLGALPASADTIVHLTCYATGPSPVEVYKGYMLMSMMTDSPSRDITVTGKKIALKRKLDASRLDCRDWYLAQRWDHDDSWTMNYTRTPRHWNTIRTELDIPTTRITCGIGSNLAYFDSEDDFALQLQRIYVEETPPRPGRPSSSAGYISGEDTVTDPSCIDSSLSR